MTEHVSGCTMKAFGHSDAAKRLADHYNLHRIADPHGSVGKWIAASLQTGSTDRTLYDRKRDAILHQHHNETYYTFIRIIPTTMNVCDAEIMLRVARRLYDKGIRMTDPDDVHGGRDVIKRATREDEIAFSHGRVQNLILPGKETR